MDTETNARTTSFMLLETPEPMAKAPTLAIRLGSLLTTFSVASRYLATWSSGSP